MSKLLLLFLSLLAPLMVSAEYESTEYQYEKNCIGIFSHARDIAAQSDRKRFVALTNAQNAFYLKRPQGYFPTAHIQASKFLHKQRIGEKGQSYLLKTLESCGFVEN